MALIRFCCRFYSSTADVFPKEKKRSSLKLSSRKVTKPVFLKAMHTLSRLVTLRMFFISSEMQFTLKGNNLLYVGTNSTLLEHVPLNTGLGMQKSETQCQENFLL